MVFSEENVLVHLENEMLHFVITNIASSTPVPVDPITYYTKSTCSLYVHPSVAGITVLL